MILHKSNKLLKIKLQVGSEQKIVMSGIAKYYKPENLIGKQIVFLANLKPRKIFGINSEGMILTSETEDSISLLSPNKVSKCGCEIS